MTNGMRNRAKKTRKKIDRRLAEVEQQLLADTTLDWEEIRPHVSDQAEYDRLIEIVDAATERNESIGQLIDRLKALGVEGAKLLGKVKKFVVT